ncbi:hypothetical protein [Knoellia koreensis]|uniref:Uncharacterized protein n=1 Tax=Knoellia koreensis TaxID=2730921 RepID=A0A849HD51_9MICO|nr:hypothetical protein [Knoellia sp. DB2414S]NNM47820.1 hypothetical protein [Knoellia sp. DB2414S]
MTGRDKRSVGELLLESDHTARAILMDVDEMDAAPMLRTWGEVVQAASELWQALPPVTPIQPGTGEHLPDSADLAIQQLQAMSEAMHRTGRGRAWPGDGPPDERLLRIAESFTRAADLISGHATPRPPLSDPERRDLQAARTRIMHTLYIGSHGVAVAVRQRVRELEMKMASRRGLTTGDSLRHARAAHARLTAFEQQAGAVLACTYPRALAGEHREPAATGRLAQALATWDVQAHRTLAVRVDTADLMLTARTQSLVLTAVNTLTRVAADSGQLDRQQYTTRLSPALEMSQERWETMAGLWKDLTPPTSRRVDPDLASAALETRAALHELLRDGTTIAHASVIAQRTDLSRIGRLSQRVLATNLDLAHATHDATTNPELTGAAQAVNRLAIATRWHDPRDPQTIDDSPLAARVTPRDLLTNRAVPLPDHVRSCLTVAADNLIDANRTAMSAAASLDPVPAQDRRTSQDGEPSARRGRAIQDRTLNSMSTGRPTSRCER